MMDKVIAYNSTITGSGKITVSLELEKRNRPILGMFHDELLNEMSTRQNKQNLIEKK